ncbi:hypothetical protein ARMGADRAFT_967130 [Armillaria gallica]|uniref:Uncharacterized protein n=1 Tax=Armillaria gallica TaxID=47427 RepID=A0A2H3DU49_ARMGA|nr:hypothetical protein ARMGADRAFT_967130 [Armillaria gallica]
MTEPHTPLRLPAPSDKSDVTQVGIGLTVKLDDLGPMVVNSDSTLSRVANWANMTEKEKETTLRVLSARNKIRLENEEKKLHEQASSN